MAEVDSDSFTETVRGIWRRVLKVDDVNPDDDFFELGGHSLNAMRMIAILRNDVESEISLNLLFNNPEFAEFVRSVEEHLADEANQKPSG